MWVDLFCKALKLPALVLYVFILVIKRLHLSAHRLLPRVLEKPSAPLCCGIEFSQLSGLTFLLFLNPESRFFFSLRKLLVAKHSLQSAGFPLCLAQVHCFIPIAWISFFYGSF